MKNQTLVSAPFTVPLSSLVRSANNVRKHDDKPIDSMVASLRSLGQLQNLIVTEVPCKGKTKRWAVEGGDRRYRSLMQMCEAGEIAKTYPVNVVSVDGPKALAASLAENLIRESMHASDEYDAFLALQNGGQSVEDIAAAFGISPLAVQRRLRLANVAPSLIERFRKGELSLSCMMAFAITDDHARQEAVAATLGNYEHYEDESIASEVRRMLRASNIRATDPIARFVGIKTYIKAGGALEKDLFDDDDDGTIAQPELLHDLAHKKLTKCAKAVEDEGFAWVECRLTLSHADQQAFDHVPMIDRDASADEQSAIDALQLRITELQATMDSLGEDDDDQDKYSECEESRLQLWDELEALQEALRIPDPRAEDIAGAIAYVDSRGTLGVLRGVIKASDRAALRALERTANSTPQNITSAEGEHNTTARTYSATLSRRLTSHYTAALQAVVASSPHAALVLTVYRLLARGGLDGVQSLATSATTLVQLRPEQTSFSSDHLEIESGKGRTVLAALDQALFATIPRENILAWLFAQDDAELARMLAVLIAPTLNVVNDNPTLSADVHTLAHAVGFRFSDWWKVNSDSYLRHVSKDEISKAVVEALPDDSGRQNILSSKKKAELVAAANDGLATSDWIPPFLRTPL
jgi:ParB family chromosome partitioning protein